MWGLGPELRTLEEQQVSLTAETFFQSRLLLLLPPSDVKLYKYIMHKWVFFLFHHVIFQVLLCNECELNERMYGKVVNSSFIKC